MASRKEGRTPPQFPPSTEGPHTRGRTPLKDTGRQQQAPQYNHPNTSQSIIIIIIQFKGEEGGTRNKIVTHHRSVSTKLPKTGKNETSNQEETGKLGGHRKVHSSEANRRDTVGQGDKVTHRPQPKTRRKKGYGVHTNFLAQKPSHHPKKSPTQNQEKPPSEGGILPKIESD